VVTILLYNDFWPSIPVSDPSCSCRYRLTRDRSELSTADAVVFHVPTLRADVPYEHPPHQTWVAWSMESDANYPLLANEAVMRCFDSTMTYRRDADIWCPYIDPDTVARLMQPPEPKTERALAVYFASNSATKIGRDAYVRELGQHIGVDAYGRALRNRTLAVDNGRETKLSTIARYKFTLAFENSISKDYVTEKFFDPLIAGSVPVYWGAPEIHEFAPARRSFIDVAEFESPKHLASYLDYLDRNDHEYEEYLAWKRDGFEPPFQEIVEDTRIHPFCKLAIACRRDRESMSRRPWEQP